MSPVCSCTSLPTATAIVAWRFTLLLLCTLCLSGVARADAYEAALTRAIIAKERALDTNEPADWGVALSRLQEVRALRETTEAMYELGFVAARLKQDDLAVEAFTIAVDLGLSGTPRQKAQQFIAANQDRMASVMVRGPAGAVVTVAHRPRGTLPLSRPLVVFAGNVPLRVQATDGRIAQQHLKLAGGEATEIVITEPKPMAADTPTASAAEAGATSSASSAASAPQPPLVATTTAPASATATVEPGPQPGSSAAKPLIWSGAATGLVSALTVGFATLKIEEAREDLRQFCYEGLNDDSCAKAQADKVNAAQDAVDTIETYKNIRVGAWVGVGVGAVVLLSGLTLDWSERDEVTLRAALAPGAARLSIHGSF